MDCYKERMKEARFTHDMIKGPERLEGNIVDEIEALVLAY
jgi:hypothetical protein